VVSVRKIMASMKEVNEVKKVVDPLLMGQYSRRIHKRDVGKTILRVRPRVYFLPWCAYTRPNNILPSIDTSFMLQEFMVVRFPGNGDMIVNPIIKGEVGKEEITIRKEYNCSEFVVKDEVPAELYTNWIPPGYYQWNPMPFEKLKSCEYCNKQSTNGPIEVKVGDKMYCSKECADDVDC
jgi:hypothetical protein